MEKKIVVIGAGIAGLSAGCYARMNGYNVDVFESHTLPGGLCTSWKRGEYIIDGCLHWLTGSKPADSFYQLWNELGAIKDRKFHDHEEFYRFTGTDGRTVIIYSDADRLRKHLKELSPGDSEHIDILYRLIRKFAKFNSPQGKPYELFGFFDILKMVLTMAPYMKDFNYCKSTSIDEFASRFKDPILREVFPLILGDGDNAMVSLVFTLSLLHNKAGGYPMGGSLEFSKAIEKRLLDLGGKIYYRNRVQKIITKDGAACGIILENGQEVAADYVISCADLKTTMEKFLDGKFIQPQYDEMFANEKLFHSSVQVSYGVNMNLSAGPDCVGDYRKLTEPLLVGNERHEWFGIRKLSFDRSLAPEGKNVVECFFMVDDFEYWEKLYADRTAYKAEKERIAKCVALELEKIYPGFISNIEMTDVLSPMTYLRYTGNYKGTYMTWIMTPSFMKKHQMIKKSLPGLENFWLSGMWVMSPGGVPSGAKTSRDIIQIICKNDGKKFVTTTL